MMKKTIYIGAAAGMLAFGGIVYANTDSAETQTSGLAASTESNFISFEEATEKALNIANGTVTDIELNANSKTPNFEVDVFHEGYEYDLKFDAVSGEVLEQKRDKDNDNDDDSENLPASSELISSDEATKAALAVAKGTVTDISLENEDGVATYDIELKDGRTEYEVEVNAVDGSIIKNETDDNDDDDQN
ncbi:PepSY domain-containing protein [Planococcus sp. YIM B11945]|uniref:PepSY domain-containing protein n=1 Tax=Planococcus sp. YIM B11945 TaxID=3435410 RepID=UPI003D7D2592